MIENGPGSHARAVPRSTAPAGRRFMGDDEIAIIGQHINTAPVAPTRRNNAVPRPLGAFPLCLLSKAL